MCISARASQPWSYGPTPLPTASSCFSLASSLLICLMTDSSMSATG